MFKVVYGRDGSVYVGDVEDGVDFLDFFVFFVNKLILYIFEFEFCCREGLGVEFVFEMLDGDIVEFGVVFVFVCVGDQGRVIVVYGGEEGGYVFGGMGFGEENGYVGVGG